MCLGHHLAAPGWFARRRHITRPRQHPITPGFLIAFWSTPAMPRGHLLFAGMATAYIFVGVSLEERDLKNPFGGTYEDYRRQVGMIVPWRQS